MSNAQFISALRDYAALARARRTSYAVAIHKFVELRTNSALEGVTNAEDEERERQAIKDIAMREYGKFDDTFSFDAVG